MFLIVVLIGPVCLNITSFDALWFSQSNQGQLFQSEYISLLVSTDSLFLRHNSKSLRATVNTSDQLLIHTYILGHSQYLEKKVQINSH